MGQNDKDGASHAGERALTAAAIQRSVDSIEPIWVERFKGDVAKDSAAERKILFRAWFVGVVIYFLLLLHRLFP